MPTYLFQNPETLEVVEIFQKINEKHEFFDENGLKYNRVITAPFVSFDTRIDPNSAADFVAKTRNKKGTIGDLLNASKELSEKRGGNEADPIKKKYYREYESKNGVKHASEISNIKRKKLKEKIKKSPIKITT